MDYEESLSFIKQNLNRLQNYELPMQYICTETKKKQHV